MIVHVHEKCAQMVLNPLPQFSRLGIQVSLAIYVCLFVCLGGLLYLSFLSVFLKLMYMYFHVHVYTCITFMSVVTSRPVFIQLLVAEDSVIANVP